MGSVVKKTAKDRQHMKPVRYEASKVFKISYWKHQISWDTVPIYSNWPKLFSCAAPLYFYFMFIIV